MILRAFACSAWTLYEDEETILHSSGSVYMLTVMRLISTLVAVYHSFSQIVAKDSGFDTHTALQKQNFQKRARLHDHEQSICEGYNVQVLDMHNVYGWRTEWKWIGSICDRPEMRAIVHICQKTSDLRAALLVGEILLRYDPCPPEFVCLDWFAGNEKWERIPKAYCVPEEDTKSYQGSLKDNITCSDKIIFKGSSSRSGPKAQSVELINVSMDVVGGQRKRMQKLWFEDLSSGSPKEIGMSSFNTASIYHYVLGSATTIIRFCAIVGSASQSPRHPYKLLGGGIIRAVDAATPRSWQTQDVEQSIGMNKIPVHRTEHSASPYFPQKRSEMVNNLCSFLDSWSHPDAHGRRVRYTKWVWAYAKCYDQYTVLFACLKEYDNIQTTATAFFIFALFRCPQNYVCRDFEEPNVYWEEPQEEWIWTAECVTFRQTRNYHNQQDQIQVCSADVAYDPSQTHDRSGNDLTLSLSNAAYAPTRPRQRRARVVHELWFEDVTPGKVSRRLGDTFDKSIATYHMAFTALVVVRFCASLGTGGRDHNRGRAGPYPLYDFYAGGYIAHLPRKQTAVTTLRCSTGVARAFPGNDTTECNHNHEG